MKPLVAYESKIPKYLSIFITISGITIYPFIIYRGKKEDVSPVLHNHELIHIRQQEELWIVGFYLLYVYYWLKNFLYYQHSAVAYYNIPFEIEAYKNQNDLQYLDKRKKHAWTLYINDELVT